jgi:hypothetical protein
MGCENVKLFLRKPLSLLGWMQDEIGKVVGMSRGRITQIANNANFGEINNKGCQVSTINKSLEVNVKC